MKTTYKHMFPHEFDTAREKKNIAYLPIGALERHGYHNTFGLDCLKAEGILTMVAERLGGVVFPSLYLGYDLYPDLDIKLKPNKGYDCYHIDQDLYVSLIRSYVMRMKHIGFKRVFLLSGHYPNKPILENVCTELSDDSCIVSVHTEVDFVPGQDGDHAGKWETSLYMATHPENVDLSLMEGKEKRLMGVNGDDPIDSNAEWGREMLDLIVENIVKYIESP